MTRLIAVILFCVGIFCIAAEPPVGQSHAQVPMTGAGLGAPTSGGFTPSCTQSGTAITALVAADAGLSTFDKTNYDSLICGLVTAGFWHFDVFYIFAAPTIATAKINLANPGTYDAVPTNGTTTFTAYQGFTGDATAFYIDTQFNPSTAPSPNFVQNSADVGLYILNNRTTILLQWNAGNTTFGGTQMGPIGSGGTNAVNSASNLGNGVVTSVQGAWNVTRSSSSFESLFLNSGTSDVTGAGDTSAAPVNSNINLFGLAPAFGNSGDQIAAAWIGKGLAATGGTDTDSCHVNNLVNTYMASLSSPINVYSNTAC